MGRGCRDMRRRGGRRRRSSPPGAPAPAFSGGTGGRGTPWWLSARASGEFEEGWIFTVSVGWLMCL